MSAGQVAQRYATAWLSAAKDKNSLDSVAQDINALLSMIAGSGDFSGFLSSPVIAHGDQTKALKAIAEKAQFNPLTVSMLLTMADARRLAALPATLATAKKMIAQAAGTASAEVTSATPLDEKKVADIRTALSKKMGQDVAIQTKVDPAIIGGLVVRIGSTLIDDSVKTKLDRMARSLREQAA